MGISLEEKILDVINSHNPRDCEDLIPECRDVGLTLESIQLHLETDYHERFELKDLVAVMNQMVEAGKLKTQRYFQDHVCYAQV